MRKIFSAIFILFSSLVVIASNNLSEKINTLYSQDYCSALEGDYGDGLMSEGGFSEIEKMFLGVNLFSKKALDFGCGTGGVSVYLAQKYGMHITGLDINAEAIRVAQQRISNGLSTQLQYAVNDSNDYLSFVDASFDIVYSKAVLLHVPDKKNLFQEFYRMLKPGGQLVIIDWLSPIEHAWGPSVIALSNIDSFPMFAESIASYELLLQKSGFSSIEYENVSERYHAYNVEVCDRINKQNKEKLIHNLGVQGFEYYLEGYASVVRAFEAKELLMVRFIATK